MGAHHAPAHVARHTRPAHTSSTTAGLRLGRLAGRGVLTASAALAMTGAGAGAALAHDTQGAGGLLADNDSSLLCGILGGDRCSSDTESSSAESSTDRSDASDSVFDRFDRFDGASSSTGDGARSPASEERTSTTTDTRDQAPAARPSSTDAQGSEPQQQSSPSPASQIDTPPPPGQVRSINLPN